MVSNFQNLNLNFEFLILIEDLTSTPYSTCHISLTETWYTPLK